MSASIEILIEADDQASKKFSDVSKNMDAVVKDVKEKSKQAKGSVEILGSISNTLGGSELGAYAGQLGGVIGKIGEFSEVSKAGGAGALAFKAGAVGAVATIAFSAGKFLGDAIFQTKKYERELEQASIRQKELTADIAKSNAQRFSDKKEDIELIKDPEAKKAAYEKMLESAQKNLASVAIEAKKSQKALENYQSQWTDFSYEGKGIEQKAQEDKARLDALKTEVLELQRVLSVRTADNEAKKKENELKDKSDAYLDGLRKELELLEARNKAIGQDHNIKNADDAGIEVKAKQSTFGEDAKNEAIGLAKQIEELKKKEELEKQIARQNEDAVKKSDDFVAGLRKEVELLKAKKEEIAGITAEQNTVGEPARLEAEQLIRERDLLRQKAEDEKNIAKQKEDQAKKIADLKQSELNKLEEERILLTQGKEAAHAFNLEKQGLDKETAKQIAKQQAANDRLKSGNAPAKDIPTAQAQETRLLTRGDSFDVQQETLDINKSNNEQLRMVAAALVPLLPTLAAQNINIVAALTKIAEDSKAEAFTG